MKKKAQAKPPTKSQRLNQHDAQRFDPASLQPAQAELERYYDALLPRGLAAAGLQTAPRATVLIQRRGRGRKLGWMHPQIWTCPDGRRNEITVAAESLNRGAVAAFEVMAHELVHHLNHVAGIRDCAKSGGYHNRNFAKLATTLGLTVEKVGSIGFAGTELGPALQTFAESLEPNEAAFANFRTPPPPVKVGSRLRKWSCACLPEPNILRIGKVKTTVPYCRSCNHEYVNQDPETRQPALEAAAAVLA